MSQVIACANRRHLAFTFTHDWAAGHTCYAVGPGVGTFTVGWPAPLLAEPSVDAQDRVSVYYGTPDPGWPYHRPAADAPVINRVRLVGGAVFAAAAAVPGQLGWLACRRPLGDGPMSCQAPAATRALASEIVAALVAHHRGLSETPALFVAHLRAHAPGMVKDYANRVELAHREVAAAEANLADARSRLDYWAALAGPGVLAGVGS